MSAPSVHDHWLSLIEISGPFLAVPVLEEAFPQGLEVLDATKRKRLRQAYEDGVKRWNWKIRNFLSCTALGSTKCCRVVLSLMKTVKVTFSSAPTGAPATSSQPARARRDAFA
jgi:hypothetical protein